MKPVVLYTNSDSNYKKFDIECYDLRKDARSFTGSNPIIAHPPCRGWGRLRSFSNHPGVELLLGVHAVQVARCNGVVVEQPFDSLLFDYMSAGSYQEPDRFGGWRLKVQLNWFGFQCRKVTALYIVGCAPKSIPAYPISFDAITTTICHPKFPKKERATTPPAMCKWLIELATTCRL